MGTTLKEIIGKEKMLRQMRKKEQEGGRKGIKGDTGKWLRFLNVVISDQKREEKMGRAEIVKKKERGEIGIGRKSGT